MANDQFLESQRLLMIDMKRMESVLSEEQQRRVAGNESMLYTIILCYIVVYYITYYIIILYIILYSELQRLDAEREAHQQKIVDLEKSKQNQIDKLETEVQYSNTQYSNT